MYPWYKENQISVTKFYSPSLPPIKTESGFPDCMLSFDYGPQSKKLSIPWNQPEATNSHAIDSNNNNTSSLSSNQVVTTTTTNGSSDLPETKSPSATETVIHNTTTTGHGCTMPVGSVQGGQNPTQGLVHWMSAVMAEHMTSNHDPTVGMHYMWNGGVDQCGQHTKELDYGGWSASRNHMAMKQGYEAKMNEHHHNNMQKGHMLDDGRLDHVGQGGQMALYGAATGVLRSGSSNSSSPNGGGLGNAGNLAGLNISNAGLGMGHGHNPALLVVPQPINATKIGAGLGGGPGTGRKYQCKMCPQIFTSKADLQLHTQIHMREAKPYKCSQCAKAFANSSYLSQHTRIHLGIKPYRCEICQRKFTQLSHLQQHIRTHTGDKPYKCRHPGCQKAFSQLSNLQSHSRCHQTDKPYKCNSCYKCFADEPSLLEHIPKHKESKHLKTHICQYCGKSYTQETYLTKHMQKHAERTDKRPPISAINTSTTSRTTTSINTQLPTVTSAVDHPYWPKVSPDSATSISEVLQQQHQQHQHQQQQLHQSHHDFNLNNPHQLNDLQGHHRSLIVESNQGNSARDDVGEDLVVSNSRQQNNPSSNLNGIIVASSASNNPYDVSTTISKAAALSNSAFTPIQSMPHLNSIGHHHQLGQRPYLYDAISFSQNKNMNQSPGNSFPNQLISLHQIRNYAHQPGALMTGEHLLGVSVGVGKDKG